MIQEWISSENAAIKSIKTPLQKNKHLPGPFGNRWLGRRSSLRGGVSMLRKLAAWLLLCWSRGRLSLWLLPSTLGACSSDEMSCVISQLRLEKKPKAIRTAYTCRIVYGSRNLFLLTLVKLIDSHISNIVIIKKIIVKWLKYWTCAPQVADWNLSSSSNLVWSPPLPGFRAVCLEIKYSGVHLYWTCHSAQQQNMSHFQHVL